MTQQMTPEKATAGKGPLVAPGAMALPREVTKGVQLVCPVIETDL